MNFYKKLQLIFIFSGTVLAAGLFTHSIFAGDKIAVPQPVAYLHPQLNYSIEYPQDWQLITYQSNSYLTIGLYDKIAQNQNSNIPDLIQGAKMEISIHDFIPESPIKDYIVERNNFLNLEQFIKIDEILIDNNRINAVRDEHTFDNNKGVRISFVERDARFYTISLSIPNYESVDIERIESYSKVFDQVISSFHFLD